MPEGLGAAAKKINKIYKIYARRARRGSKKN